jgi:hypothetical protein
MDQRLTTPTSTEGSRFAEMRGGNKGTARPDLARVVFG